MNDRELLELAAKAAGIDPVLANPIEFSTGTEYYWNPLTDDGDALRLAVNLKIGVQLDDMYAFGIIDQDSGCGMCECLNGDPGAATRRAIVRAAAAIGEAMP